MESPTCAKREWGLPFLYTPNKDSPMLVNDIKKGARVKMRNGWFGTMADNKKGNIRDVIVEGIYTERGSVYSHDIACVLVDDTVCGERWVDVSLSPAQEKSAKLIKSMGF